MVQGTAANMDAKCCTRGCEERRSSAWSSYCRECSNERQRRSGGWTKRGSRRIPDEKPCTRCGVTRPLAEFGNRKATRDRRSSWCRECLRSARREWADRNGYRTPPSSQLVDQHGLTTDNLDAILLAQGGGCAICGTRDPGGRNSKWHIDHDHSLGCHPRKGSCGECRRGILCAKCNIGLGYFNDDANTLQGAVMYLSR